MCGPVEPSIGVAMYMRSERAPECIGASGSEDERPASPPSLDPPLPVPRGSWARRCQRWLGQAKKRLFLSMVPGVAPVRQVSIAMVALSPATEARLRAACLDVAAMGQGYTVALVQWNGQCPDVVVADSDDVYARMVCALAIRSRSRIVRLSAGSQTLVQRDDDGVLRTLSHANLVALIARLCMEMATLGRSDGVPECTPPELSRLPRTCLLSQVIQQETAGWTSLAHGRVRLHLNRLSSRTRASSQWHLDEAARHLLSPVWRPVPMHGADGTAVETGLDPFLLRACLSQQAVLPRLDATQFRLAHWPDLDGEEPQYAWVLPLMASVVRQAPVGVPKMAGHAAPSSGRINALFWAFWASGVLERVAMPPKGLVP